MSELVYSSSNTAALSDLKNRTVPDGPIGIQIERASKLSDSVAAKWSQICDSDQRFANPLFRPEMTQEIGRLREHAFVASLVGHDGQWLGVFPFERNGRRGQPVGAIFSDYHGIVSEFDFDTHQVDNIVNQCGLRSFRFHHVPTFQRGFDDHACYREISPIIDLSGGYHGYLDDLRRRKSKFVKRMGQKSRKLAREHGCLELQFSRSEADHDTMRAWKARACKVQGRRNIYEQRWAVELFRRLLFCNGPEINGELAVLRAGRTPIGMAYLLRSYDGLHVWKIANAAEYSRYSPGLLLLHHLIQESAAIGVQRIDLARGEERFKVTMQNSSVMVAEGWIGGSAFRKRARSAFLHGKKRLRESAWEVPAKRCMRWGRRLSSRLMLRD